MSFPSAGHHSQATRRKPGVGGSDGDGGDERDGVGDVLFFSFRQRTLRWKRSVTSGFESLRSHRRRNDDVAVVIVVVDEQDVVISEGTIEVIVTTKHSDGSLIDDLTYCLSFLALCFRTSNRIPLVLKKVASIDDF